MTEREVARARAQVDQELAGIRDAHLEFRQLVAKARRNYRWSWYSLGAGTLAWMLGSVLGALEIVGR